MVNALPRALSNPVAEGRPSATRPKAASCARSSEAPWPDHPCPAPSRAAQAPQVARSAASKSLTAAAWHRRIAARRHMGKTTRAVSSGHNQAACLQPWCAMRYATSGGKQMPETLKAVTKMLIASAVCFSNQVLRPPLRGLRAAREA